MTAIGHSNVTGVTLDRAIELAVATGVAVLVAIGFVTSYETLRSLAVTEGGFAPWLAPAVPLSFDLGIVVLSLKIVAAARRGRHALVHRALVVGLSVATVAVNGTASSGTAGRLLHAIPPAMFVICFEGLIADARRDALAGRPRRTNRWRAGVPAPFSTLRSWREGDLRSEVISTPNKAEPQFSRGRREVRPKASLARSEPSPSLPSAAGPESRLAAAREALHREPQLAAPALARVLAEHGHSVSVRTAQRLKARLSAESS